MPLVKISETERQRVNDILDAIRDHDWERFDVLSDGPFANDASMKEQFWHAVNALDFPVRWESGEFTVNSAKAGRFIEIRLPTRHGGFLDVAMMSSSRLQDSKIAVWAMVDSAWLDNLLSPSKRH